MAGSPFPRRALHMICRKCLNHESLFGLLSLFDIDIYRYQFIFMVFELVLVFQIVSLEDNFNGRRPQWKTTTMEDNHNER